MITKKILLLIFMNTAFSSLVFADEKHGNEIYHAFQLELGVGGSLDGETISGWDLDAWIGTDENKVWFRTEGELEDNVIQSSEIWAMFSTKISTFWDAQVGIRYDTKPYSLTYGTFGLAGLAPYFFETEAYMFISEYGDFSTRIRQENELLVTQRLIIQPYMELNLFAQEVTELEVGSGLSDAEFGLQTRYELTPSFAPYFDLRYERKFGKTATIAENNGKDSGSFIGTFGIKFLF